MIHSKLVYALFIAFVILGFNRKASAQCIERVYMKDGSVVEGYIAEQQPGSWISVQATKATIVVNSDTLLNKSVERMPADSLPDEWKQWASENDMYMEVDGKEMLELHTLEFANCTFSGVYIIENGSLLTFVDLTPGKYTFRWQDMSRSVKNKRPSNLCSGLKEVLILDDDSRVEGRITEQTPGKDLKIETNNGEIQTYKFTQVKTIQTRRINENHRLWSQIPLLDMVRLKDGATSLVGFISSRTLGKELVFEFEDGSQRTIQQNQIASYAKMPNDQYVAEYDHILKEGEVLLNGKPAYFANLQSQGEKLLLGEFVSAIQSVGELVCVEANLREPATPMMLVKAHLESVSNPMENKKNEQVLWPVVTYRDLVQSSEKISRETTPLGHERVFFTVEEVGDYVLYIQGKEGFIVINVIE